MAVIRDVMPVFELFQPARSTMRWRCWIATGRRPGCWRAGWTRSTG